MTPEGPAHLVAWSWRCRMVGSPTAAADISSYPPLGTDARDSPVVPRSYSARESPAFTELDSPVQRWILPYRLGDALGRKLCEVIWGQRVPVRVRSRLSLGQCGQVSVVACSSAIRSRLSPGSSATKPR